MVEGPGEISIFPIDFGIGSVFHFHSPLVPLLPNIDSKIKQVLVFLQESKSREIIHIVIYILTWNF